MSRQVTRVVLSAVVGSIGVAIGLYFGRFIAGGVGVLFASSREALSLATSVAWWAFIGLVVGAGLAVVAVRRGRVGFILATLGGFILGGVIAGLPEMGRIDRNTALSMLAVPLGGALAGLLMGLAAQRRAGSLAIATVAALAMWISRPHFALLPPSDLIALLVPGALIGLALSALAPDRASP